MIEHQIIKNIYLSDNFFETAKASLKGHNYNKSNELLLQEAEQSTDLHRITNIEREFTWDDGKLILSLVDKKNVIRFQIWMFIADADSFNLTEDDNVIYHDSKKYILNLGWIQKVFTPLSKARKENLINLSLNKIICSYSGIYYEDDSNAFEITAKTFFDEYDDYELKGAVDTKSNVLIFTFEHDVKGPRYSITTYYFTCAVKLKYENLEAKILDVEESYYKP